MTEHDEPLKPLLAPDFVDVWLTLTFSLTNIKAAEEPLEHRDCVKVTPPSPSQPGWVVRMGYTNDGHAELAARAAAVEYLLERTRPALSAARDYFHARDLVAAAEEPQQSFRPSSTLSGEVRRAAEFLDQCDKWARGDGF